MSFAEFLSGLDWSPLWISLKTGIVATVISFFLGIWLARLSMTAGRVGKAVLDGLLTLPMVLPPTAMGFFLLLLFSRRRPVGIFLEQYLGIRVVQTWLGCIIAATVIAFPLMYRNARAAFEQVDINMIYAAQTLGMPEGRIFRRVILPAAKPGIASGTILAFSRALGEYGATSMIAGYTPGRTATISTTVYQLWREGNDAMAYKWVLVNILISFLALYTLSYLEKKDKS